MNTGAHMHTTGSLSEGPDFLKQIFKTFLYLQIINIDNNNISYNHDDN